MTLPQLRGYLKKLRNGQETALFARDLAYSLDTSTLQGKQNQQAQRRAADRKAAKQIREIEHMLLTIARKKVETDDREHMRYLVKGIQPTGKHKFLTNADLDFLHVYIFGSLGAGTLTQLHSLYAEATRKPHTEAA